MVWVTPDWNAGVDGWKRRGRVEQMSAPGMNTVPREAGKEIHTQGGSREPSVSPGTGWAVERWSLAGSRGPTGGDQGPHSAGRGLESWGHFLFLRSPAGCSCPLLPVPCPSLCLALRFCGGGAKEASGRTAGVSPLEDGRLRQPGAADPARDHPGGGGRRGWPGTPTHPPSRPACGRWESGAGELPYL